MSEALTIGTTTPWGRIVAVGWVWERYYWIVDRLGGVAMMPASVVESR